MKQLFLALVISFAGIKSATSQIRIGFDRSKEALYTNKFDLTKDIIKGSPLTIVCYMENIGMYNKQTDMILKSLDNYFHKGYSFSSSSPVQSIPVIILYKTNTTPREIKTDCYLIKDSTGEIFSSLIYKQKITNMAYDHTYSKSTADLYVIDNKERIRHQLQGFHSFGEELRPFENMVHKLAGDTATKKFIDLKLKDSFLKEGSTAPDFYITPNLKLSDLTKNNKQVIISFYPAPFTGAGLRYDEVPYDSIKKQTQTVDIKKFDLKEVKIQPVEREFYGGCGGQAMYLDMGFNKNEREGASDIESFGDSNVVVLYISEGNETMLKNWGKFLGTETLQYVSDPGFKISQFYGSYNYTSNLNKRSIFVIGKNNRVKLVNYNMEYFYNAMNAVSIALDAE